MTAEQADLLKFVLIFAACWFNSLAVFILALHVVSALLGSFINYNPIGIYCLISVLYSAASASDVKISSSIRYVLFLIAVLNFGAALEYHFFSYKTIYYYALPYLINTLDAITLLLIFTGGCGIAGLSLLHNIRIRLTSFHIRYFGYNLSYPLLYFKEKGKP